jgi:cell division protein ZapB
MSLEVLEQLEAKVQMAVDTISLLQLEIEELKEKNDELSRGTDTMRHDHDMLLQENERLRAEQDAWQDRIRHLLGKMEEVE